MISKRLNPIILAILAAALYGVSSPISKRLLEQIPPTQMAAFLYLGAGIGILAVNAAKNLIKKEQKEAKLTKKELPYVIGMIALDIAAPILLMLGLSSTTAANASLLNNFEIVSTSLIALLLFKEAISKRMWLAISLITCASIVLSIRDYSCFSFSLGSISVIAACICWGLENNCTRMLSLKDPLEIVVIKGFGSGIGSLFISFLLKERIGHAAFIFYTLVLGFVAYGLSIYFYIKAQRELGAARTSAYYAAAPFIGVFLSWIIYHEGISSSFVLALIIMLVGAYFAATERHHHMHAHLVVTHEHKHNHSDGHHGHSHTPEVIGEHTHIHTHDAIVHDHPHSPDLHHKHTHEA